MSDRHRGPRQEVVRVIKSGDYGTTWWSHWLECGHVEKRKRKSPFTYVGCGACAAQERLLINIFKMEEQAAEQPINDFVAEDKAQKMAASVAKVLSIPVEFVDVKLSDSGNGLKVTGALVWIPKEILENLV